MGTIEENWRRIAERVALAALRAGRPGDAIEVVAVSKTVGPAAIREACAAGARHFGESRAQECAAKREALADLDLSWHFVGHLQTNKVRLLLPGCGLIHSVDRIDLARRIDERSAPGAPQRVLVQVNTTGSETQAGVAPRDLAALLDALAPLEHLIIEGLMTIGPLTDDEARIGEAFGLLRRLAERERQRARPRQPLGQLSMGMSGDFEIAVAEGATLLRIGTAIFGARP